MHETPPRGSNRCCMFSCFVIIVSQKQLMKINDRQVELASLFDTPLSLSRQNKQMRDVCVRRPLDLLGYTVHLQHVTNADAVPANLVI